MRARLAHPLIDGDGHLVESAPVLMDFLQQAGAAKFAARYEETMRRGAEDAWQAPETPPGTPVVCACAHLGDGSLSRRWPQARVAYDERALSSCALPRDALTERLVRHGLRVAVDGVRSSVRHLAQRRPPRRGQTRPLHGLARVTGNRLHHRRFDDAGDDPHCVTAPATQQGPLLVDARQQQRTAALRPSLRGRRPGEHCRLVRRGRRAHPHDQAGGELHREHGGRSGRAA